MTEALSFCDKKLMEFYTKYCRIIFFNRGDQCLWGRNFVGSEFFFVNKY